MNGVTGRSVRGLMFTDIEGSTALIRRLGSGFDVALERHQQIIRSAVGPSGGVEQSREGDSMFVTFPSASAALEGAIDAQRRIESESWPADGRVRIRIGLHVGEVAETGAGLVGLAIHQAARIMSAANGGQIVASDDVLRQAERMPVGVTSRPLGHYQLRDIGVVELHQLDHPDLPGEFPALRTRRAGRSRTSLPVVLTPFVGRTAELAAVVDAVTEHRLVCATGPGGVGKTRLALAAAQHLSDEQDREVVFVDLVKAADPEMVVAAVADAVGVPEVESGRRLDTLVAALTDRTCLLLIDNCEHVRDAARICVERVLECCPAVRVLATSRVRLMLPFEHVIAVPGLSLDAVDGRSSDAVTLFVDRMVAAGAAAPTNEQEWRERSSHLRSPRRPRLGPRAGRGSCPRPRARRSRCRHRRAPRGALGGLSVGRTPSVA